MKNKYRKLKHGSKIILIIIEERKKKRVKNSSKFPNQKPNNDAIKRFFVSKQTQAPSESGQANAPS